MIPLERKIVVTLHLLEKLDILTWISSQNVKIWQVIYELARIWSQILWQICRQSGVNHSAGKHARKMGPEETTSW